MSKKFAGNSRVAPGGDAVDRFPNTVPKSLRRVAGEVPEPRSFFTGIRTMDALMPDNIITYYRSRISEIKSSHVSANYHHRFELLVLMERGGIIRIGDSQYLMEAGEAFLVFPNQFHVYSGAGEKSFGWLFCTFNLPGQEFISALRDSPRRLDSAALQRLRNFLDARVYPRHEKADGLEVSYMLAEFLRAMLVCPRIPATRCNLRLSDDRREVIVEKINTHIRENLGRSITLSKLAKSLGYSVSYLRAVFRDLLGVSLGRYIRESRLAEAAQLLQEPEINVTDAARRCGFQSLVVFSRAFKNTFGIAPKDYSKMVQKVSQLGND